MDWALSHKGVSSSAQFWRDYFRENPDALHYLLGEIYRLLRKDGGEKRRRSGDGRGSLEELWNGLTVETSEKPFSESFLEAAAGRSIRSIAPKVPIHFSQLAGMVNGTRRLVDYNDIPKSMRTLESIAAALGRKPAYFLEWRRLYILGAVLEAQESDLNRIARGLH